MNFPLLGALVNTGTVILGSLVGLLLKKGISKKLSESVMLAMSLCVVWLGVTGALECEKPMVIILSVLFGALLGEMIDLDKLIGILGNKIEKKVGSGHGNVAQGFVSATLIFCVGAMTIMGSLDSGLKGDHSTQITKAMLDFVSSMIYASTFGIGVLFAALSVLFIQGGITLLAVWVAPVLEPVISEMSVAGSILLVGLGLNMMGVTRFKLMNYVPAIFLPILVSPLYDHIVGLF